MDRANGQRVEGSARLVIVDYWDKVYLRGGSVPCACHDPPRVSTAIKRLMRKGVCLVEPPSTSPAPFGTYQKILSSKTGDIINISIYFDIGFYTSNSSNYCKYQQQERRITMITIREYTENDAKPVGKLIAETYSQFNLAHLSPDELKLALGPFQYAWSDDHTHKEKIASMIRSEWVFVAVDEDKFVGVIRARKERLASLFVRSDYHRQGVARQLVERFEEECQQYAPMVIRLSATVYAVPFYIQMGYKKSTGLRSGWSFDYHGLPIQPMRKVLKANSLT